MNNQTPLITKRWKKFQEHLEYIDEELSIHRSNPKHIKAMENAPKFALHRIIIEVIESHNCGAGYKVGDKFVVDGEGFLVAPECPQILCVAVISAFKPLVDRMWQAFYNDSTDVLHDTVQCPDVGVHRGGWGEVTMRVYSAQKGK